VARVQLVDFVRAVAGCVWAGANEDLEMAVRMYVWALWLAALTPPTSRFWTGLAVARLAVRAMRAVLRNFILRLVMWLHESNKFDGGWCVEAFFYSPELLPCLKMECSDGRNDAVQRQNQPAMSIAFILRDTADGLFCCNSSLVIESAVGAAESSQPPNKRPVVTLHDSMGL
jgi:hypothetical protein